MRRNSGQSDRHWKHRIGTLLALTMTACGGGREAPGGGPDSGAAAAPPAVAPGAPSASAAPGPAPDASAITPQMVALGDSIFKGQAGGGTCYACHGMEAKGGPLAPDLTDAQWVNGDGSYGFIVQTVRQGVPQPKQAPAPMPPMGGASLNDDQVTAVSAYVYSLTHK